MSGKKGFRLSFKSGAPTARKNGQFILNIIFFSVSHETKTLDEMRYFGFRFRCGSQSF
jgi:hypothetical protein